ncbi:MAG: hypothetical protein ABJB01_12220 [Rudaea sp.]
MAVALACTGLPVHADQCICFHIMLDKDSGTETLQGSHETECGSHTGVSGLSASGPSFEPSVIQKIAAHAGGGGRIIVAPSSRLVGWVDDSGEPRMCTVPDVRESAETQPVRTAVSKTTTVTFSLDNLPAARVAQARLAANGWNRALAEAGKATRFLEVTGYANVRVYAGNLTALTGVSHDHTVGATFTKTGSLSSHPEWLVPSAAIALNTAFDADFAKDPMLAVQVFGHEFGHTLGLLDVAGHQLMSGATQYTSNGDITKAMPPGEYEPNICEVAKLGDNGLP